ncbi:TPA: hypothetical protein PXP39_003753 [Yersinia enterocolitica]|nr:hypothetical protein [Yersinia enterocolitica]HDL7833817.1 hypothetical protein [Yersinia enterocolitica]HDL7874723.1 hypothetical protein [Yersinia enterocolitica]HDL7887052.1 hypothetical protein [Yersinia enterocolitica]HDL7895912.1 hypothetical protein [Yersinia enterocolitica]
MNSSDAPKKQPVPFGVNGSRENLLPTTPSGDNSASYDVGFPPITMILKAAGGLPPKGQDMNQILYELSSLARWNSAGAMNVYDSAFSTAISGYPKGAILANSSFSSTWLNTTEANTASPESSTTSGWVPSKNYGVTAVTGLAGANVTLTALQASNDRITLSGTLTANINLVFPSWLSKWIVTNNCTGNFTVTCKTASGTGVAIPVGTTAVVFSDGTNITLNGPLMVQAATNNNHAVNLGQGNAQWSPVVGASRNAKMSVTAASATATFTADQLTVTTGLSGQPYLLTSFSKTINLATTGAGGMDAGSAPASGFLALYAIYNPATQASALLAVNATSSIAPEVYGGGNMPSGYTASALVSIWKTSAASLLDIGLQRDRHVDFLRQNGLTTSTQQSSYTAAAFASLIPRNAKTSYGDLQVSTVSSAAICTYAISPGISVVGATTYSESGGTGYQSTFITSIFNIQTVSYLFTATTGAITLGIYFSGYDF